VSAFVLPLARNSPWATDAIIRITFGLPCRMCCVCVHVLLHGSAFMAVGEIERPGCSQLDGIGSIDKRKVEAVWRVKAVMAGGWLGRRHHCPLDPENPL